MSAAAATPDPDSLRGISGGGRGRPATHGMSYTRLYKTWQGVLQRCQNKNAQAYKNYGGRGIAVCQDWQRFESFYAWAIRAGYSDDLSIDRINNDGPYAPENCRWATRTEQNRNTRTNRILTFRGESLCINEWAERLGLNAHTIRYRLDRGWSAEQALTPAGSLSSRGETPIVAAWARRLGIAPPTLRARLKRGWSVERALGTTVGRYSRRPAAAPSLAGGA